MKALFLAAGAAAMTATLPASAQVISLGSTLAEACYRAAQARDSSVQALETCRRSLSEEALTFNDRFATHVNRGILRMFKRHYIPARSDFATAIAMAPNRPEPWLNLAIMQLNEGDAAGSIPLFTRALQLRTDDPALAYYGRGLANEYRGDVRAAYRDLRRAASLKPDWDKPAKELARFRVRGR